MALRRAASVAAACALAGCALLSGASDLVVDPSLAAEAGGGDAALEAPVVPPGADATIDAGVDVVPVVDVPDASLVRSVTFEDGTPTGPKGADNVFGNAQVQLDTLEGSHALKVQNAPSYARIDLPTLTDVYVYFLVDVESNSSAGNPPEPVLAVLTGGSFPTPVSLALGLSEPYLLRASAAGQSASGGAIGKDNSVYRVGIHARRGIGDGLVEVWLAKRGVAFGAPILSLPGLTLAAFDRLHVGNTGQTSGSFKAVVDEILVYGVLSGGGG